MPARDSRRSLLRAASLGLALGIAIAGIVLMVLAIRTLSAGVDCGGMLQSECQFQQDVERSFARWQLWVGMALELLAVGAFLGLRASDRKAAGPPSS